jgi:hypothetical protein
VELGQPNPRKAASNLETVAVMLLAFTPHDHSRL